MVASSTEMAGYDRESEVKAFDESMAGVKGLVDAGVKITPQKIHLNKIFISCETC